MKDAPCRLVLSRALLIRWTSQRKSRSYVAFANASTAKSAYNYTTTFYSGNDPNKALIAVIWSLMSYCAQKTINSVYCLIMSQFYISTEGTIKRKLDIIDLAEGWRCPGKISPSLCSWGSVQLSLRGVHPEMGESDSCILVAMPPTQGWGSHPSTAGQAPTVYSFVILDDLSILGKLKVTFQISFFLKSHL